MAPGGKRVLIVKQSSLGDVVHTLPVVHALTRCHPDWTIGWVVNQPFAPLVQRDPAVAGVYPIHIPSTSDPSAGRRAWFRAFTATLRVLGRLRREFHAEPWDLVLDLHASFRSGLLALMNPGGRRLGFADARELNTLFQHQLVQNPTGRVHAVEKNLLFAEALGCPPEAADFHLCTDAADERRVAEFLAAEGIAADEPVVYVNPTARWATKFWLVERWAELADRLLAEGIRPVFGGSGGDVTYIGGITGRMHGRASVAAGALSLTESAALMRRAAVYAGLDTGPMHMAAMIGTPVVALFGPTHPERVGPYRVAHAVVRAEGLDCLSCRRRSCDHLSCMRAIATETVYRQVMAFVRSGPPGEGQPWTSA